MQIQSLFKQLWNCIGNVLREFYKDCCYCAYENSYRSLHRVMRLGKPLNLRSCLGLDVQTSQLKDL